jgi:hypothetical protein
MGVAMAGELNDFGKHCCDLTAGIQEKSRGALAVSVADNTAFRVKLGAGIARFGLT